MNREAPLIKKIVVCGAGTMGSGIAQLCAVAGFPCVLYDTSTPMLEKGLKQIEEGLQALIRRQKLTEEAAADVLKRITCSTDISTCTGDLIIEAIIENLDVKQQLFARLAQMNTPDTILATNTSSLPVSAIQETIPFPGRVLGMHFFNPAPIMKLVEIVKGKYTAPEYVTAVQELAIRLGKTAVICADAPGFIVNRVARPYYLEALKLVEEGVATLETIDAVMEASGFKLGPFRLMDLIGIDVNYAVSNIVWEATGKPERLKPSALQQKKVQEGQLGRKTLQGFYDYRS